jgi:hypothetical protein
MYIIGGRFSESHHTGSSPVLTTNKTIKHKFMNTEMAAKLESRPELQFIIDELQGALDRYEELLICTRGKLSMIRSYDGIVESGEMAMEIKPIIQSLTATEEIKNLLCRFKQLNSKAALNYDHLDKIV